KAHDPVAFAFLHSFPAKIEFAPIGRRCLRPRSVQLAGATDMRYEALPTTLSLAGLSDVVSWFGARAGARTDSFRRTHCTKMHSYRAGPNLLCTATPTITQSSLFDRCSKAMIRLTRCTSIRARGGSVHELAQFHPVEKQFVCYHVMTYLAFYKSDERKGRGFEVCSGALGSSAA